MKLGTVPLLLSLTLIGGCSQDRSGPPAPKPGASADAPTGQAPVEWFIDRAAESGLNFLHYNGASGHYYYPEILGPGVALFDYDNDGDLDVYIVQGRSLGSGEAPPPPAKALHFTDVTEQSGIDARGYGLGVAAGDIDNDGWVDLYLMNFGPNQMLHNNG